MSGMDKRRSLPSVDALLKACADLERRYGRMQTLDTVRAVLTDARTLIASGGDVPDQHTLLALVDTRLRTVFQPTLRPVINATGVIIHTNLGRAPLSDAARQAVVDVALNYNTLEFDLQSGGRGSRSVHSEAILREVTGAEAALVVNNNAAGLVLLLSALANGREVVISRGQLVEIGGGFRVPEVMEQSGARLVEVGTTNRTRASDYERAVTADTALIMRAHYSNFKVIGFTEDTPLSELAEVAHARDVLLVDDVGSGALLDTAAYGLDHEPTVQESLAAGCDLVAFSGDKLLGGPQAGLIVGKRALIQQLKQHPLARAIRADKLCLAALTATLDHYRRGEATTHIPVWRMIAMPMAALEATAHRWAMVLGGRVIAGESTVGGGSLPGATLPTALVALESYHPDAFADRLRTLDIPVIVRIQAGRVLIDPRTVLPGQEESLLAGIRLVLDSELS